MSSPAPTQPPAPEGLTATQKAYVAIGAVFGLALLAGLIFAVYYLANHPTTTENVRDIFIILMALESFVIGVALIVLIIQLAQLTNLLRHEIKPILDSTNETVNTVRGTTIFISDNLVEPIVKLNSYIAAIQRFVEGLQMFIPRR